MTAPSLYGHGSWFEGSPTARDVDVLAVTADPMLSDESPRLRRFARLVVDDAGAEGLPIDLSTVHPDEADVLERAIIHGGAHLCGPDVRELVAPPTPEEWAAWSALGAVRPEAPPRRAVQHALGHLAALEGRILLGRAVTAEEGGRWADIAAAAATGRVAEPFEHPDLVPLLATVHQWLADATWQAMTASTAPAGWWPEGDDLNPATEALHAAMLDRPGATGDAWRSAAGTPPAPAWGVSWLPRAAEPGAEVDRQPPPTAPWTIYRPGIDPLALTPAEVDEALAQIAPDAWIDRTGNPENPYNAVPMAPELVERLAAVIAAANACWWRFDVRSHKGSVRALGVGQFHRPHLDLTAVPETRKLTAVAMLSDPDDYAGGELVFTIGSAPYRVPFERGTVVVAPGWILHEVQPVTAGRRVTAVLHAYGPPFR